MTRLIQWLCHLEPRQQRLIGGGLLMLLLAASTSYIVMPELRAYRAALSSRGQENTTASASVELAADLMARQEIIDALKRKLRGDMADLPARETEAFVIGRLQSVSWRHDVELISVEPGVGEVVERFEELRFQVELRGQYADLFAWIRDLRAELGFVVVREYALELLGQQELDPLLKATLTLAAYRMVRR